jgi:hypothetical protein
VNTAVLMFAACLPGQVHAGPGGAYPAQPYPAQPYAAPAYPAPAYPAYPAPVVVTSPNRGGGDCCGYASVGSECCPQEKKCCLSKIWSKLSCFHIDLCGKCNKGGCDTGHQSVNSCNKCGGKSLDLCGKGKSLNLCHKAPACPPPCPPAPVCNPCPPPPCPPCPPAPACKPCPKPVCCKSQPVCEDPCAKSKSCCWTPGYFLHKCKEKFSGCCGKKDDCPQPCPQPCPPVGAPNACGSAVIPPAYTPAPGTFVPGTVVPGTVVPGTPVQTGLKKTPQKVGSAYPLVHPTTSPASAPRTIDLGSPF